MTVVATGTLSAFSNISYHKEVPVTLDHLQLSEAEWNELSDTEKEEEVQDYMIRLRNEDIQLDFTLM
jgi:hypothetical protein